MNKFKIITINLVILIIAVEIFSAVLSKLNLLRFNKDPIYFKKLESGEKWRYKDEKIGPWHKKNFSDNHKTKCFETKYASNNIGARDDKDYFKNSFENSTIIIGDSFAEGYGIEFDKTFIRIIEKNTNKKTINLATAGTNPKDHLKRFEHFITKNNYSEIIYFFFPQNDFLINETKNKNDNLVKENRSIINLNKIKLYLSNFTYTFNSLATIKSLYFNRDKSYKNYSYNYNDTSTIDATYYFIEEILKTKNIKKTLFIVPTRKDFQFNKDNSLYKNLYWYKRLEEMSKKYNFKLVDIYGLFNYKKSYQYYHQCDFHWNSYGNEIVANYYLENLNN